MNEWIKVKDRMPEINQRVLVFDVDGVHGGNPIDIDYRCDEEFWNDGGIYSSITHWMKLPEVPNV